MGIRKVRDGDSGREIPFRLEVIDCGIDEDGDQITTCVVHWEPDRQPEQESQRDPWTNGKGMVALHQALTIAVQDHGRDFQPRDYVAPVRAAALGHVREEFKLAYLPPADEDPVRRRKATDAAFRRSVNAATSRRLIGIEEVGAEVLVWKIPVSDNEPM
jgi:hypothetical protein